VCKEITLSSKYCRAPTLTRSMGAGRVGVLKSTMRGIVEKAATAGEAPGQECGIEGGRGIATSFKLDMQESMRSMRSGFRMLGRCEFMSTPPLAS
jgi:hypothetical protein